METKQKKIIYCKRDLDLIERKEKYMHKCEEN